MGVFSVRKSQEEFENEVFSVNPNVKIIGVYIGGNKKVKTQCLKDGYIWYPSANNLIRGHGCPVCSNRIALKGVNDISTTHPEFIKYFNDINDAYTNRWGSHKKVLFKCPDCGNIESKEIKNVITQGFSCSNCGDYISYPNKFIRCFLNQLDIENIHFEYSSEWTEKYFYDAYFEVKGKKYIVEMDGDFHFKDNRMNGVTKEEICELDRYKNKLALQNGVKVIRIECRESNFMHIVNNIKNSVLGIIFDLSKIDWDMCNKFATSNFIKHICEFYEKYKYVYSRKEMLEILGISTHTFISSLKRGIELGWCTYDEEDKTILYRMNFNSSKSKPVIVRNINTNVVNTYKSIGLAAKMMSKESNVIITHAQISTRLRKNNNRLLNYEIKYA